MFSMWHDPRFKCVRECRHRCRLSHGRFPHCGPSLLEDSGRARSFAEFARRNPGLVKARGSDSSFLVLSKRRKPPKRTHTKESHQNPKNAQKIDVPRNYDPIPIVAKPYPKPERVRDPRSSTSLSRIGKCLGSRSFGKLTQRGTKKVPFPSAGLEVPLRETRVSRPRKRNGRAANQKQTKQGETNNQTGTADALD